ncbi:MAG: heterodisulfide reductase-related iron-sulfur binding cluster [Gammaproteobacteria bacterium]
MAQPSSEQREGSLDAPSRTPIDWRGPDFYDENALNTEMERIFDICHGCRRCVNLCNAFPTLFDLVDESESMEVDGVDKQDYSRVADQCFLCDLCFMTKCPYVPPHPWAVDFPHLMLRAKAVKHRKGANRVRDRLLSSNETVGQFAGIPIVAEVINASTRSPNVRRILDRTLGIHPEAYLPTYHRDTLRKRMAASGSEQCEPSSVSENNGKVALFVTCYGNYNEPQLVEDLIAVFRHNKIEVVLTEKERCCGMPKLEIGDLGSVEKAKESNIPELKRLVDEGFDIIAPVPSCVLMFKQEIPLLFPEDEEVQAIRKRIFDPFEYLMLRHKEGKLDIRFQNSLGTVAYHVPCHQRVQNIGLKTRDVLSLVPGTSFEVIERCSGHDGSYGLKSQTHEIARKICRPVASKLQQIQADHFVSDCPLATHHIELCAEREPGGKSPFALLRYAYGI